jgi:hypothetical protein
MTNTRTAWIVERLGRTQKRIAAPRHSRYSAASRIQPIGARFFDPDLTIPYSSASIGVA